MKVFKRHEALDLRKCFKIMMPFHLFIIVFCDIYAYEVEILSLIADSILLWLDYYNFMILDKPFCIAECVGILMTTLIALTHIERGFKNEASWISILAFVFHFLVFNPAAAILTLKRFKLHAAR